MFSRFTGTKKPVEPKEDKPLDTTRLQTHISSLDAKENSITQKIQDIDNQLATLTAKMKQRGPNYNSLRTQASNLLKRRKLYENQLRSVSNMNLTMNQTQMTIDGLQMMQEQYNVMKEVSAAQSEMFSSIKINDFMDLSDKMQDMREDMDDVQEMMAEAMVGDVDCDEDELDAELAAYAAESMPAAGESVYTPAAPVAAPTAPAAMPELPAAYNMNDDLSRL